MAWSSREKANRRGYLLRIVFRVYKINCYFCGKRITEDEAVDRIQDSITVHHKDEDRSNDTDSNLKFSHRNCHRKWHKENPF